MKKESKMGKFSVKKMLNDLKLSAKVTLWQMMNASKMRRYINGLSRTMAGTAMPPVRIINDPNTTAYICNKHVVLSVQSSLIRFYDDVRSQWMSAMGHLFHEWAHARFLDFEAQKTVCDSFSRGVMLYGVDEPEGAELRKAMRDPAVREAYSSACHQLHNIIADAHDEQRLIEKFGGFAAEPMYYFRQALQAKRNPLEEDLAKVVADKTSALAVFFNHTLSIARWGEYFTRDEDALRFHAEFAPFLKIMDRIKPHAVRATQLDNMEDRQREINNILAILHPLIMDELIKEAMKIAMGSPDAEKSSEDSSDVGSSSSGKSTGDMKAAPDSVSEGSSGDSSGDTSAPKSIKDFDTVTRKSAAEAVSRKFDEEAKKAGATATPVGTASKEAKASRDVHAISESKSGSDDTSESEDEAAEKTEEKSEKKEEKAAGTEKDPDTGEKEGPDSADAEAPEGKPSGIDGVDEWDEDSASISSVFDSVYDEVREESAEDAVDSAVRSELGSDLCDTPLDRIHNGCHIVNFPVTVDESKAEIAYNRIYGQVKGDVKRLQREIMEKLQDLDDGGTRSGLITGKYLEAADCWRPDYGWWSNRKDPENIPEMAVCVLVDESGSMSHGIRMNAARQAAILLYEFCHGLGIPVAVFGHDASGDNIQIRTYMSYENVSPRSKYRLAALKPYWDNRDGLAIAATGRSLVARPEPIKLMFVISDGQPLHTCGHCACSYSGSLGIADTKAQVALLKRKGIETIGFAIGSDKDAIRNIYGNNFIDISDLNKLPKTMATLLQKRILANLG